MDAKERMTALLEHIDMNANALAKELGVPKYRIYDIVQGRTQSISYEIADKINSYNTTISREWLLTGEGEMLTDHIETKAVEGVDGDLTAKNAIRFYPNIPVTASHIEDMPEPSYDDMGYQLMKIQGWEGCVAYTAVGDSMYPRISNGDIVVFSKWRENYISNGEIYLIVTRNGDRSIKYLTFSREDEDGEKYYTCTSANPDQKRYAPFEIQGSQIVSLYIVHGCVKRFKM